jgi:hypothetical protein
MDSLVRVMSEDSWMGDLDLGDMFLNFPLDKTLRAYCGIDLYPFLDDVTWWERWTRCMMGLKPSPYSIKGFHVAFEVVRGDKLDPRNVFHWSELIFNLPGQANYDPTMPRVWKLNPITRGIAADCAVYVDDLRTIGPSFVECWRVMHRISTYLSYLGIQVAARKTRPPSPTPGPWAGAVAWASAVGICVRSTKEKWVKVQTLLHALEEELQDHLTGQQAQGLEFKRLERTRGFLVHLQRTYPAITPYLKGLHLTIDSWRPGRDSEGRKEKHCCHEESYWDEEAETWSAWEDTPLTPPDYVIPVP